MQVLITLKVKVKNKNKRREGEKMSLSHNKGPQSGHRRNNEAKQMQRPNERGRKQIAKQPALHSLHALTWSSNLELAASSGGSHGNLQQEDGTTMETSACRRARVRNSTKQKNKIKKVMEQ